jgi:2-dehydropantoate 2-reductase
MKIAVVGAGAMGSVYAALLAKAGNEVWAVDVWQEHIEAIRANGLHIEGASGDNTVPVNATTDAAEVGACDLVILATKARHVSAAAASIEAMLAPDASVLTIQNGLGSGDAAAAALGAARVSVGVAGGFGAKMLGPGHARHEGMELIRLGEMAGPVTPRLEAIAAVWSEAGFKVKCFDDIHQLIWEKLICNGTFSAVCTLTDLTAGGVLDDPDAWAVASACATEGAAVARAKGVTLDFDDAVAYVHAFGAKIRGGRPSMWQDMDAGRPGEIDAINGAIAAAGKAAGVATPTHDTLTALVRAAEVARGISQR